MHQSLQNGRSSFTAGAQSTNYVFRAIKTTAAGGGDVWGVKVDGSSTFAGPATATNFTINTEADNPANYTGGAMVDDEEVQVYNGPTLNVKEVLLDLQQRVADRDAVIADLTARIAALEGAP